MHDRLHLREAQTGILITEFLSQLQQAVPAETVAAYFPDILFLFLREFKSEALALGYVARLALERFIAARTGPWFMRGHREDFGVLQC